MVTFLRMPVALSCYISIDHANIQVSIGLGRWAARMKDTL